MILRRIEKDIKHSLFKQKIITITGPRQSGKTTLVKKIASDLNMPFHYWNGDETDIRTMFSNPTSTKLLRLIGDRKLVIIDEAQRIENIGIVLKLIIDNKPEVQVIATGSSSFELSSKIKEPLTGRKFEYLLLPFSFEELVNYHGLLEEKRLLEDRMIFGYFPEIVTKPDMKIELLKLLADSYLYKDILSWSNLKKTDRLERLVQALALQIGSQVNYSELGMMVGMDNETVEKYIDILEKAFIVFRLNSFSRNLRNELKKSRKIFFWDTGIRNAVINNFNPVALRTDIGQLWENFVISERMKFLQYNKIYSNCYFWRTYQQQEIDFVEERAGKLWAYEIKWKPKTSLKIPKPFSEVYPNHEFKIVSPQNIEEVLLPND